MLPLRRGAGERGGRQHPRCDFRIDAGLSAERNDPIAQQSEKDMTYFTARIRARSLRIGYDENGDIIAKDLNKKDFVEKVIKLDRILSFTDDHLFVACPHNTVEVWEYEGDLKMVKERLRGKDLLIE
jgi:hypothetical protein